MVKLELLGEHFGSCAYIISYSSRPVRDEIRESLSEKFEMKEMVACSDIDTHFPQTPTDPPQAESDSRSDLDKSHSDKRQGSA